MASAPSTCPHCQTPVNAGTRFCGACGKTVVVDAPAARPMARTMIGMDAASVQAAAEQARAALAAQAQAKEQAQAQPQPQPPPASVTAASGGKLPARTMIGIAASEFMASPAAVPAAAAAAPAAAPAPSNSNFAARTMIGGVMPPPSAAMPASAAAGPQRPMLGGGRTMLGVPLSSQADDAAPAPESTSAESEFGSFSTSPGSEPAQALAPAREGRLEVNTLVPRSQRSPLLLVGVVVGLGLVGAAAFLLVRSKGVAPPNEVTAKIVTIDTGEALLFDVPAAPAGSKVRFGGQEKPLQAGRATFALAADSLRVGDNVVLADVVSPSGENSPARITLAVFYRIWVDTAALRSDKSALDVVVTALPGTKVTLDGQDVKLDAEGRATRSYPIDVVSDAKAGIIDHVVHYRVQPPSGETVADELHTQIPVANLQIDRPGREVVTDHDSVEIAGAVAKDTQVTIDGTPVAVTEGRFLYRLALPAAQTYQPRVVASALGKAPVGVTLTIKRVDDLAAAAREFVVDSDLTYAKLAPNPSIYRGQKIAIEGRVYATDARGSDSVIQLFARPCPSSQRCSLWVDDPAGTEVAVDVWVRVLGTVEGEHQFRSEKNDVVTVPKVKASFILPAKP